METIVTVLQVNHYDMGDNRGLSARIVGSFEENSNKFGLSVSEATIPNYEELSYLKSIKDQLPAKFKAQINFGAKKASNGKEITGVSLSKLEFLNSVEMVDVKAPVTAK